MVFQSLSKHYCVFEAFVSIYAFESVMSSINLTAFRAHKTIQTFITSINISLEIFAISPHSFSTDRENDLSHYFTWNSAVNLGYACFGAVCSTTNLSRSQHLFPFRIHVYWVAHKSNKRFCYLYYFQFCVVWGSIYMLEIFHRMHEWTDDLLLMGSTIINFFQTIQHHFAFEENDDQAEKL